MWSFSISSLTYHNHHIALNRIIDNKRSQTFLPARLPSPISRFKTVKADVIWAIKIAIMTSPNWIQMMEKMRPTTDFGVLSPYLWRYTVLMRIFPQDASSHWLLRGPMTYIYYSFNDISPFLIGSNPSSYLARRLFNTHPYFPYSTHIFNNCKGFLARCVRWRNFLFSFSQALFSVKSKRWWISKLSLKL